MEGDGGGPATRFRVGEEIALALGELFPWPLRCKSFVQGWLGDGQGIHEQVFRKAVHRVPLVEPAPAFGAMP